MDLSYDHLDNCTRSLSPPTIGFATAASDLWGNCWWVVELVYMTSPDVQIHPQLFGLKQVSHAATDKGTARGSRHTFPCNCISAVAQFSPGWSHQFIQLYRGGAEERRRRRKGWTRGRERGIYSVQYTIEKYHRHRPSRYNPVELASCTLAYESAWQRLVIDQFFFNLIMKDKRIHYAAGINCKFY